MVQLSHRVCTFFGNKLTSNPIRVGGLLAIMAFVVFANFSSAVAAPNTRLNYQARVLTSAGALIPDGLYHVEYKLYSAASGGSALWTETYTGANTVTVANGYVSVQLGSLTAFPGTINWSDELWLTINIGGNGGSAVWDGEMTPRTRVTAVPYAFEAGKLRDGSSTFGAADFVQKAPSAVQLVNAAQAAIRLNQTGVGGLLQLQTSGTDIFTVSNTGLSTIAGNVDVNGSSLDIGSATAAGALVLNDGGGNTLTLNTGTQSGNLSFTLPTNTGTIGQCLKTNGAGVLSFGDCATAGGGPTVVDKLANETVINSATLQNDNELFFPVAANENWVAEFIVHGNFNQTPDVRFAVTAPAGATCIIGIDNAEAAESDSALACGVSSIRLTTVTANDTYIIYATIRNGANAGNVTLQWAQFAANATNTTVLSGSYLVANKIGPGSGGTAANVYVNNGNSFGAGATLGTNDSNSLTFETNNAPRITISAAGDITAIGNISLAEDTVIGDAASDRLSITSQITGANPLVFQGATDNAFTTTFNITDPTVNRTITFPNASGTVILDSTINAALGSSVFLQNGNSFGATATLGTNDSQDLVLETNAAGRVFIQANGDVGVGQAASGQKFYIQDANTTQTTANAEITPVGTVDPTNVSTGDANLINNIFTDLTYNDSSAGSANKELPGIDLGSAIATSFIRVTWWNNTYPATDYNIQGSNNGTTWTNVVTGLNGTGFGGIPQDVTVNTTFRYWRVFSVTGLNATWAVLSELEAFQAGTYGDSVVEVYNNSGLTNVDLLTLRSDVGSTANRVFRVDSDGDVYSDGVNYIGAGADIAENYKAQGKLLPGDVVYFVDPETVGLATEESQAGLAGVVSTQAGIILNAHVDGVPIGLSGKLPTRFSYANGPVLKGDYITSGPGGASVKAIKPGQTIGIAMEDSPVFDDPTQQAPEVIIDVFVNLGFYNPTIDLGLDKILNQKSFSQAQALSLLDQKDQASLAGQVQTGFRAVQQQLDTLTKNSTGVITIPAGQTSYQLYYNPTKESVPYVVISPLDFIVGPWRITSSSKESFTVEIAEPQSIPVRFNWNANFDGDG